LGWSFSRIFIQRAPPPAQAQAQLTQAHAQAHEWQAQTHDCLFIDLLLGGDWKGMSWFAKSWMFLTMLLAADCMFRTTVFAKSCPGIVVGLVGIGGVVVEGVVVEGIAGPEGLRGMFQYHHQSGFGVMTVPGGKVSLNWSSNFWSDRSQSMF